MNPDHLDTEAILDRIKACPQELFDGHTDFHKLSAHEKLLWLSHTVYFVYAVARRNPQLGSNDLFST